MTRKLELKYCFFFSKEDSAFLGVFYNVKKTGENDSLGLAVNGLGNIAEIQRKIKEEREPVDSNEMTARIAVYLSRELKKSQIDREKLRL